MSAGPATARRDADTAAAADRPLRRRDRRGTAR